MAHLHTVEFVVDAFEAYKLGMLAHLGNYSSIYDADDICVLDGQKAMCNCYARSARLGVV